MHDAEILHLLRWIHVIQCMQFGAFVMWMFFWFMSGK